MVSRRGERRGSKLNRARNPPIPRLPKRPPVKLPIKKTPSTAPFSPIAVTRPVLRPRPPVRPRPLPVDFPKRKRPTREQFLQSQQPVKAVPRRSSGTFGIDFVRGTRPKPTRVRVDSPSGSGRTLTVSSRSKLARSTATPKKTLGKILRARIKKKGKGLRKLPRPDRSQKVKEDRFTRPRRRPSSFGSDFDIFKIGNGSEEIAEEGSLRRRRRSADEEFGSDFDVLNFFA